MRYIIRDKIYDTKKAELLCTFSKQWKTETIFGTLYPSRVTNLYKTAKGAFFLTSNEGCYTSYCEVIDETTAKELLKHNAYDKYIEMYGELEEA